MLIFLYHTEDNAICIQRTLVVKTTVKLHFSNRTIFMNMRLIFGQSLRKASLNMKKIIKNTG